MCFFCEKVTKYIDYKDVETLRRFISSQAKILGPKRTGVCQKHQRMLSRAIKRARLMALLPFTNR